MPSFSTIIFKLIIFGLVLKLTSLSIPASATNDVSPQATKTQNIFSAPADTAIVSSTNQVYVSDLDAAGPVLDNKMACHVCLLELSVAIMISCHERSKIAEAAGLAPINCCCEPPPPEDWQDSCLRPGVCEPEMLKPDYDFF